MENCPHDLIQLSSDVRFLFGSDQHSVIYHSFDSKNQRILVKLFGKEPADHKAYQRECQQFELIEDFIRRGNLNRNLYANKISASDQIPPECGYQANIVYSSYAGSLDSWIRQSTAKDINVLITLIYKALTAYIIMYQKTSMLHGQLTYNNIWLDQALDQAIISGFGSMVQKPRSDKNKNHMIEVVKFILQLKDYLESDDIKRPWLQELLNKPALIVNLSKMKPDIIDQYLIKAEDSELQTVFDHWLDQPL